MASMSISLSDQLRGFIKSRVKSGDYHNESEYIRDLVRKDREKLSDDQHLLSFLKQSDQSGTSQYSVLDIMKNVKENLMNDGKL
jgi:antitoxin ParD1/3/4